MEALGERGGSQGEGRKAQAGLHLDYEIFITCLPEQGQPCSPATASPPGSALKCTSQPSPGPCSASPPSAEPFLRQGAEKVKKENEPAHLGFASLLGPSSLTCASQTAFDGGRLMLQVDIAVPMHDPSPLTTAASLPESSSLAPQQPSSFPSASSSPV